MGFFHSFLSVSKRKTFFLYSWKRLQGGGGREGRHCFSKRHFSFSMSCFWIAPPELVKAQWSVRSFKNRGFCSTPYKGWFYTVNEWPAAGVQFHGVSNLWCKGAFPSLHIQKNLNVKDENERTARLCGSCASEGNAFAGNSIFLLKEKEKKRKKEKERKKKKTTEKAHQRRPILCIFFYSDGFPFSTLTEMSVDRRGMLGDRRALVTFLRCSESELERLQICLGWAWSQMWNKKDLVQMDLGMLSVVHSMFWLA